MPTFLETALGFRNRTAPLSERFFLKSLGIQQSDSCPFSYSRQRPAAGDTLQGLNDQPSRWIGDTLQGLVLFALTLVAPVFNR